jgi:hypothetical protein
MLSQQTIPGCLLADEVNVDPCIAAKLLVQRENLVKSEILRAWEDEVLCQYPEIDESPNVSFDACMLFAVFSLCNNSSPVDGMPSTSLGMLLERSKGLPGCGPSRLPA